MTSSMEHFKKKYDLEIVEENGIIVSMHCFRNNGDKVEMKLTANGDAWVTDVYDFSLWIPVYK
jgi:hypothetical protein